MSDVNAIPPPGPERDAEIARLLDPSAAAIRDYIEAPMRRLPAEARSWPPPYSTDPAACDRLVEEMVRRGYQLVHRADARGHGARFIVDDASKDDCMAFYEGRGATRPDAVSAAALLALRGAA